MRAYKDLTGQKFGRLTVIKLAFTKNKAGYWECLCDCGNTKTIHVGNFKSGKTKSCGCILSPDLTGKRYGNLTVISLAEKTDKNNREWNCLCDCGKEIITGGHYLNRGSVKSCGCLKLKTKNGFLSGSNRKYGNYKSGAKRRSLSFDLTQEVFEIITLSNCYYCNKEPYHISLNKSSKGKYVSNGIDRIDSSIGYTEDNCVPCCEMCNRMKMAYGIVDFKNQIKLIYENLKEKGEL